VKKALATVLLLGGVVAGVGLAGGLDGALDEGRRLADSFGYGTSQPAAPQSQPPAPVPPAAPEAAAPSAVAAPRARIERGPDGPPREHLTDDDRARLDRLIGDRLGD